MVIKGPEAYVLGYAPQGKPFEIGGGGGGGGGGSNDFVFLDDSNTNILSITKGSQEKEEVDFHLIPAFLMPPPPFVTTFIGTKWVLVVIDLLGVAEESH